jgi:UDP-hydrolysing UDP-N-acetyl-D-glucosamine 2-epimerase
MDEARAATSPRIVAVFTGNRAEFGNLQSVLKAIARHPALEHTLIVSGAHVDPDFGLTLKEIESSDLEDAHVVEIAVDEDSLFGTTQWIGRGVVEISSVLNELQPDLFLVSGDRYEAFAAAIAATQMGIPTAHIEGGDVTEGGALDDAVRHAITKLAHVHFATNDEAAARIRGLGEEDWRVMTTGLPSLDLVMKGNHASSDEVAQRLELDIDRPVIVFTQHSVATEFDRAVEQLVPSLEALEVLVSEGSQLVVTYPNNDAGGVHIAEALEGWPLLKDPAVRLEKSLGRYLYHGLLKVCADHRGVCAGNSSSGIKETPAFGCPTVNIGPRQRNRLRGSNLIDVGYDATEIESALRQSLWDEDWRTACRQAPNPYWDGDAGEKIAEALAQLELGVELIQKKMVTR